MKEFSSIKFEELGFPRYVKVKESIESLIGIIDFDKVKEDGIDRVLHAILQLIDENDDMTIEEKREVIEDAIYNGNVFRHYFSEENQAKAVDVLSKTSLLNDEERLVYIINFFMPNDVDFTNTYGKLEKNIDAIAHSYGLTNSDSNNLVYARVAEISKFYKLYQEEKERQKINTLAAMQEATENPSPENIERVKSLLDNFSDLSLKETLMQQLEQVESNETENDMLQPDDDVEQLFMGESSQDETQLEEDVEEVEHAEETVEAEATEETIVEENNIAAEEPQLLDEVLPEQSVEEDVGKDVMASLQNLVTGARESAKKVEQLSLDLELKDKTIADLQLTVETQKQELSEKETELQERDKALEEQNAQLELLNAQVAEKEDALAVANREITLRDEKISSLSLSLNTYKASLAEIQSFLNNAQTGVQLDENPRKVA